MIIHSKSKDYEVILEKDTDFLKELFQLENTLFVIDYKVYSLYEEQFLQVKDSVFLIDAIENNKVINTALAICEKMTEIPAKRNARIISIGGGIVQDITGFASNILYRGIQWIYIPTTLLAASDSCIGGKTSLNYKHYKNLLGTFFAPDEIHICPAFFKTLSKRDYESGLGEVIKFNIMAGKTGQERLEQHLMELLNREDEIVADFVKTSLQFKKSFIEEDEFDRGERIKLNFAHTFGHAIETITEYEIPHGTAVAIGMIMAGVVSRKRDMISEKLQKKCEEYLLKVIHIDDTLLKVPLQQYILAMKKDKKQTSSSLTLVLMNEDPFELQIVKDVNEQEIEVAINYFLDLYRK